MSGFDVRATVREVLTTFDEADLPSIVSVVMNRIPQDLSRVALQQTISGFVRQVISEDRLLSPLRPEDRQQKQTPATRSAKVAAIRSSWRRQLDGLYPVVGDDGTTMYKRLGAMNYSELMAGAEVRWEQGRKNNAKGDYMAALAEAVQTHGVECPDALPENNPLAAAA